jgi:hypothetical protein
MKTLKISRRRWLRGTGAGRLYDPDTRRMCCLGFYLRSCGLSLDDIREGEMPSNVTCDIPAEAQWLLSETLRDSAVGNKLSRINDDRPSLEKEREAEITRLFAEHGVKVVFTP